MNDTVPTALCNNNTRDSEIGQNLRELVDTPLFGARPVSTGQSQRISFTGGETLKIRLPDLGEVGLSDAEIEHCKVYGISA